MENRYLDMIDDVNEEQADLKEQFIKEQMTLIRKAKKYGCNSCVWKGNCEEYQAIMPEMQRMFRSKGYRIEPKKGYVWWFITRQ